MIRLECDYSEGAHPLIMERLLQSNLEQTIGYGEDPYCERADDLIKQACGVPAADVHFLVGGTQTNTTVISSILRPHQGVVAAESGHINVHESGAIEATGHKVLALPSADGKIRAAQVEALCLEHLNDPSREHMVQPGMVYVSQSTEKGTIYSRRELRELSKVCRRFELPLFMDGARLGYALAAEGNDLDLKEIARCCEVFYIGGTKVGALFGEAVVITAEKLKKDFRYLIKQKGGMLAKGRLLGIQFETLFQKDLYLEISKHAVELALHLREGLKTLGYSFLSESPTNQQFPILPDTLLRYLEKNYIFSFWAKPNDRQTAVRICTSWATPGEHIKQLLEDIRRFEADTPSNLSVQ
ncbi:MAG: low specificity L-threonine aldolase [Bacteroidales bacterium]|nr:low specificity L-threonine aldolase [Bacteroidales bacterium]MDD3431980.1 low specificity L-threonine aldolase [Bacteroidales bacterium]MDD4361986.1 low specificity L-threonine aldolase [Bacteroidales bacterium]